VFNELSEFSLQVVHVCSLLKVHLQLRGLTVFLDIEKLRAGKFDDNLLSSVRNARHFILVLTPGALDRCVGDSDRKDWVHRVRRRLLWPICQVDSDGDVRI